MIDIALYVLLGIAITLLVQRIAEGYKHNKQHKENMLIAEMRRIAEKTTKCEFENEKYITLNTLRAEMTKYIDSKLTKNEGECGSGE